MGISPGSWYWGLDDGTPLLVDPFKANRYFTAANYLAERYAKTACLVTLDRNLHPSLRGLLGIPLSQRMR